MVVIATHARIMGRALIMEMEVTVASVRSLV